MKIHTLLAAFMIPTTIVLATGGTTACGKNACEEAADIAEECAPPAGSSSSSSGTTTTTNRDAECTGTTEQGAKCISENKDAFCAFIKNPVAEASNQNNAYIKCSAALTR